MKKIYFMSPHYSGISGMIKEAVDEILKMLPDAVSAFEGTEYPLPVKAAVLGGREASLPEIRQALLDRQSGDVKDLLEPLLLASELIEAAAPDKDRFFIKDKKAQAYVFTGAKWRSGWALVLGAAKKPDLVSRLLDMKFMVFTDQPDVKDTVFIGDRHTSPVYFLQLMVRYGLVWGRIAPGDDHRLGHFLETDMPGLLFICRDLPPLKYLVALGLMKLGAPAVVPSSFPFPYGNRVVADDTEDMITRGCRFGNLRRRYFRDEVIGLPDTCNPAYINEDFKAARVLGGRPNAFFCLRRSDAPGKKLQVSGKPARNIGILVEIFDERLTDDIALTVENAARRALNTMKGVRALQTEEAFILELAGDTPPPDKEINDVLYRGVRLKYPRLKNISVSIYYDEAELAARAPQIEEYRKRRRELVRNMTEANTEMFCVCTECRPFSLVHTCILTPDRLPMCAARTYFTAKAAALFGSDDLPYQRAREKDLPLRKVFDRGRCLDPLRGEYEGCNAAYAEMTQGQLTRVFLHSIREFPITSCGCFQTLAFWIPEVEGIGIMSRGASARTPDGRTWEMLANAAGGKQTPGIAGLSLNYIRSANFLKGDGGIKNLVWVNSELREKLSDALGPGCRVATEKDVQTMDQLRSFLGR